MKNLQTVIIPEPAPLTELAEGQKEEWGTTPCSTKENYRFKIEDNSFVHVGQGTRSCWDYYSQKRREREMRAMYEQIEMDIEYRNEKALHESSLWPCEQKERQPKDIPYQFRIQKVEDKKRERLEDLQCPSEHERDKAFLEFLLRQSEITDSRPKNI